MRPQTEGRVDRTQSPVIALYVLFSFSSETPWALTLFLTQRLGAIIRKGLLHGLETPSLFYFRRLLLDFVKINDTICHLTLSL